MAGIKLVTRGTTRRRPALIGLVIALLTSFLVARNGAAFIDTSRTWASQVVDQLKARGVVDGVGAGRFSPDSPVTRAQVARMLVSALRQGAAVQALRGATPRFADLTADHWAADYVEVAAELGVFKGYGDGSFHPDATISRLELATVMVRVLGLEKEAAALPPFSDQNSVPDWGRPYLAVAAKEGLVQGYEDGTLRPAAPVTRAEAASLVARLLAARGDRFDVEGSLTRYQPDRARVELEGRAWSLAQDAAVYVSGRKVAPAELSSADLSPDLTRAILDPSGRITYLDSVPMQAIGRVKGVDPATGKITWGPWDGSGPERSALAGSAAAVFKNGRRSAVPDLAPGDRVYLLFDSRDGGVRAVDAVRVDAQGVLAAPAPPGGLLSLTVPDGRTMNYSVAAEAVAFLNGDRAALSQLRPGDRVILALDPPCAYGTAVYVEAAR